jgi:hypothetical protein
LILPESYGSTRLLVCFRLARDPAQQSEESEEHKRRADQGKQPFQKREQIGDFFETYELVRIVAQHGQETKIFGVVKKSDSERKQAEFLESRPIGKEPGETTSGRGNKEQSVERGENEVHALEEETIGVTAFRSELDKPLIDGPWRLGKHHVGQPDAKQVVDANNARDTSLELDEPEKKRRGQCAQSNHGRGRDFQEERV